MWPRSHDRRRPVWGWPARRNTKSRLSNNLQVASRLSITRHSVCSLALAIQSPRSPEMLMDAQRTLRRSISCAGIGLHSGRKVTLSLKPAPADFGIRFRRTDLGGLEIPANVANLGGIQYATGLTRDQGTVDTIEHLLAAVVSRGVDNVIIELNTPEVPIMDGSAAPFVYLLQEAGSKRQSAGRRFLEDVRPIAPSQGGKRGAHPPSDHFKVTYSISFDHPFLRHQARTHRVTEESFAEEIA